MAASVELVVVDEVVGIRPLCPAPRGLIELIGEDAYRIRNGDVLGVEEVRLVLPVVTSRGYPGVRQPIKRDVVEDVVACQATCQGTLQGLFYETGLPGTVTVVDHERREVDG